MHKNAVESVFQTYVMQLSSSTIMVPFAKDLIDDGPDFLQIDRQRARKRLKAAGVDQCELPIGPDTWTMCVANQYQTGLGPEPLTQLAAVMRHIGPIAQGDEDAPGLAGKSAEQFQPAEQAFPMPDRLLGRHQHASLCQQQQAVKGLRFGPTGEKSLTLSPEQFRRARPWRDPGVQHVAMRKEDSASEEVQILSTGSRGIVVAANQKRAERRFADKPLPTAGPETGLDRDGTDSIARRCRR